MRDRIGQDDIESGEPIGGNEEQSVAEVEDFPDFAGTEFGNARQLQGANQRVFHGLMVIGDRCIVNPG